MQSNAISSELTTFESAVTNLATEIARAAQLWKDEKYSELSDNVKGLANISKEVITIGRKCCSDIEKLEAVASETY